MERRGNQQGGADQFSHLNGPAHKLLAEKVLHVNKADDVVEVALVDRQPREAGHGRCSDHFLRRRIDVQGIDLNTWGA